MAIASLLSACSTPRIERRPAECAGLGLVKLRDACAPGETPILTPIPGGQIATCTALTASDMRRIAEHNATIKGRCENR